MIGDAYNPTMLAKTVCTRKGYTFAPAKSAFWNRGFSTETDHLYMTDKALTHAQLRPVLSR